VNLPVAESSGADDLLRRIERRSMVFAVLAAAAALILTGGQLMAAVAVLGGAFLSATSYWAIKRGVTGIADAVIRRSAGELPAPGKRPRGAVWFVGRYALLAGIAYVMIARLRLAPIGLLCGASVTLAAAAAEVVRQPRVRPPA
jgi:hypothetical protein